MAPGISSGRRRRSSKDPGFRSTVSTQWEIVLTVESWPATSSNPALVSSSLGVIGPSGPSQCAILESMLSAGFLMYPSTRSFRYCTSAAVLASPFALRAFPSSVAASGAHVHDARHKVVYPGVKLGFVLQRNAQDLANHHHRHRVGVIVHDVDPGLAFGLVEQLVAELLDSRLRARNEIWRVGRAEVSHRLTAHSIVVRRIGPRSYCHVRRTPPTTDRARTRRPRGPSDDGCRS